MEGFITDARYMFCGKLNCLSDGPKHCNFGEIISSTSCINHAAVISMDVFLLLMSLLISIWKGQPREIYTPFFSRYRSPLKLTSVLLNACLGFIYVGLGIWLLVDELRKTKSVLPLHKWLEPLFHGLAWSVTSLIMSLGQRKLSKALKWTALAAAVVLSGLLSVSSIVEITIERKLTLKTVIDILCLPGGLILILVTLKMSNHIDVEENGNSSLYEPLNETSNDIVGDCCGSFSPFAAAGVVSRLSFWWLNPLMKRGYQKILEDNDVPCLREIDRSKTQYLLFMEEFNKQKKVNNLTSPSIFWVIVYCHWKEICVSGLFAFVKIMALSAGPMLLKTFIKLAKKEDGSWVKGCAVALTFFLAKCLESISQRQWYFRSRIVGVQVRSLLSAVIYSKQLRLSNSAKILHSSGELMSYMTVDAYRVGEFPFWLHQTWTTLFQICLALMILFNVVGLATIAALVVVTLTVLCNLPLAKLQHKFQTKLMEAEDARLKAMTEALMNMKVLKLYAWETNFKTVIEGFRKVELKWLSGCQTRRAYNSFLFWTSPVFVSAATFGTCYLIGIPLNATNVFTFVATMRILQDPIRTFPDVIGVVIQAKVAFSRIVKFLDAPELQNLHVRKKHTSETEYPIAIKSASFSWEEDPIKLTLRNINLEVKRKDKVAICGEVGSGKSSLLAVILGEIPNTEGLIEVNGKIAYVSQTAWIPQGTIQDNIIFGSPMDKQRYKDTLERCSLVKDLDMLPFGDLTEIGERGVNLSGGQKQRLQLARALYQDADIYLLDDPFSAVDAHTATSLFNDYVMGALADKTVLLVTHQVDFLPAFDYVLLLSHGEILQNAPYYELMSSSAEFQNLVNAHKEVVGSKKPDNQLNVKKGKDSKEEIKHMCAKTTAKSVKSQIGDQLIKKEEKETGDTGLKPYLQYLNQNRGYLYFSLALVSHIMFLAGQISQNSWMAANVENPQISQLHLISVYLAIGFTTTIFLLCRSVCAVVLGLQSSKSLFSQLLDSLFRAPMSFFDSTPVGRILSRVSTDMSIVDLDIPFTLIISASAALNVYSNLGVLATITWQILLVSLPMVYLTIQLQKYYYAAGKELMRINGTTKSAVANHISESILGVITIRAFQEEERFFSKTLELIDRNASPFLHTFAASEWLLLRLEVMGAIVLSSTALSMALLPRGTFSSGLIGMALSYGLSLNNSLVASVRNQCTLANYIISVERLNQFVHIPSEAPEIIEGNRTAPEWPTLGKVEIQDLKIRYRPESPLVIQGLTCTFEGGQKIGVVGRTGSGKTTLISALFRLVEPAGGKILVDGVDIATIGLHDLRSRFAIIPQDPTLFSGTVRYNLDPLGQYADEEIWEVLSKCQLLEAVQNKNEKGLYSPVMEDGSNWSIGQRQLFCLCRALLKRSRVLVLDEATASIDNATDLIIQKTVRAEFADSTVITVAHRIPTVMDCSSVLAISDGKLVEFDKPEKLMQTDGSLFAKLVKEYWSHALNASSYSSN